MKNIKILIGTLLALTITLLGVGIAKAATTAPNKIKVDSFGRLSYIGSMYFTKKQTNNGDVVYCLNFNKKAPHDMTMTLIGEADAGLTYIIQNGYPHKSFTGNNDKDRFITAIAIWWYLDDTTGMSNLSSSFRTTASDKHNLRPIIKKLVADAKAYKPVDPSMSATVNNKNMVLTNSKEYYESEYVTVSLTGADKYNVSSKVAGVTFIDESGNAKTTFNAGEKFKVRTTASSMPAGTSTISITMSATAVAYKTYKYKASDSSYQNVIDTTLYPIDTTVEANLDFTVVKDSGVKISKQDISNKQELKGATLVVKDSSGNVIESWVSSDTSHYIKLQPGTYTLEETIAPNGYILSTEKITFTVKNDGTVDTVVMYNTPNETGVKISKQDISNKRELKGATLVVKDANGKVIESWVSSDTSHYIKLQPGTYTLEETLAPKGYALSTEKITFTVKNDGTVDTVVMYNTPDKKKDDVKVPDTASSKDLMIYFIGGAAILGGIGMVYRNGKKQEEQ